MGSFQCSPERPWGIHLPVRNDEACGRCGWTAPGPAGDARAAVEDAVAAIETGGGWDEALAA